jgi:prepilin-type N-terminal cleavage/methylation domain-containing protein
MNERKQASGFTLMESVIAIGILAVLLTTFMAVFGPAMQGIRRAISVQEADRLASALEREMQIIREEEKDYDTAFEKAFDWIRQSGGEGTGIFLYNYRGDPSKITDGRMEPYTKDAEDETGEVYVLQAGIRRQGDPLLRIELEEVEGAVYYVRMVQLVFEDGALTKGVLGEIVDPHDEESEAIDDSDRYPEAVIAFSADFYVLKSNAPTYVEKIKLEDKNGDGRPDVLGRPLFTRNLAVRR